MGGSEAAAIMTKLEISQQACGAMSHVLVRRSEFCS
jgi:hypothetical protein